MSARQWQPGDVARVRFGTGDWETAIYQDSGEWACMHATDVRSRDDVQVRPLVVIDPEDRDQVARLRDGIGLGVSASFVADALRSLVTPPKPEEPTGLGAVVEDADGYHWVYSGGPQLGEGRVWISPNLNGAALYCEITAVRILSQGVTE